MAPITSPRQVCYNPNNRLVISSQHCPAAVFVLRTSPRQACSLVCADGLPGLCRIARLRVAAQLILSILPVPPGFGLLRNSTPWQASLWLSPISAPVFADGLPGRKKGNQISLVAFVKPGGADVDCSALKFSSKNAVNPSFTLNIGTLWHNVTRLPALIFWGINGENHRLRGKNGEF